MAQVLIIFFLRLIYLAKYQTTVTKTEIWSLGWYHFYHNAIIQNNIIWGVVIFLFVPINCLTFLLLELFKKYHFVFSINVWSYCIFFTFFFEGLINFMELHGINFSIDGLERYERENALREKYCFQHLFWWSFYLERCKHEFSL